MNSESISAVLDTNEPCGMYYKKSLLIKEMGVIKVVTFFNITYFDNFIHNFDNKNTSYLIKSYDVINTPSNLENVQIYMSWEDGNDYILDALEYAGIKI